MLYIAKRNLHFPSILYLKRITNRNRKKEGNKIEEEKKRESAINLQRTKNTSYLACFSPLFLTKI